MKADIAINVNCPECGKVMHRFNTEKLIVCHNPDCGLYEKQYLMPQIELIEIKKSPYQELILAGQRIFNFHPIEPFSCLGEILMVAKSSMLPSSYEKGAARYAEVMAMYIEDQK